MDILLMVGFVVLMGLLVWLNNPNKNKPKVDDSSDDAIVLKDFADHHETIKTALNMYRANGGDGNKITGAENMMNQISNEVTLGDF